MGACRRGALAIRPPSKGLRLGGGALLHTPSILMLYKLLLLFLLSAVAVVFVSFAAAVLAMIVLVVVVFVVVVVVSVAVMVVVIVVVVVVLMPASCSLRIEDSAAVTLARLQGGQEVNDATF
jgi:hypothetical protein